MREVYEQMDCWCVRGSICLYCKLCHSGLSAGLCLWMRYGSQRVVTVLRRRASKWPVLPAGSSFSSLSTASQWQMDPRQKKNRALCTKKEGLWYNSSMCCRHSGCKALCFSLPVSLSVSFCDIFFPFLVPVQKLYPTGGDTVCKTLLKASQCAQKKGPWCTMCTWKKNPMHTHLGTLGQDLSALSEGDNWKAISPALRKKEREKDEYRDSQGDRLPWNRRGPDIGLPSGPGAAGCHDHQTRRPSGQLHQRDSSEITHDRGEWSCFSLLISFNLP